VQPGTYFYHGHFGTQRAAGFYGALIVDLPIGKHEPYNYDGEHMIIVNDWWHRSIVDQEEGLESTTFKWVGEPQVPNQSAFWVPPKKFCEANIDQKLCLKSDDLSPNPCLRSVY